MAKASKKKKATKKDQEITGSFDQVISASVSNVGHPKKSTKSKKK